MEDAILGNSKGATYKSFILDVEIVIRKEGVANVAERKVKNKSKEEKEESQDSGRRNVPERNKKQDVYVVNNDQPNFRKVDNQPKYDEVVIETTNVKNRRYNLSNSKLKERHGKDNVLDVNMQQRHEISLPYDTNHSETSSEKHHKKKRVHRSTHSSKMFKDNFEPVDFLECNRIFMCNYLHLRRQNSDSALYCNYVGTLKKTLHQEYVDNLDKRMKNAKSAGEIFSLLEPRLGCKITNNKFYSSTTGLGTMYSSGDGSFADDCEISQGNFEKLYFIKNTFTRRTSIVNVEVLHNYLKENFLKEQAVKENMEQSITSTNDTDLQINLSSGIPTDFQNVTHVNDVNEVESLPNIKVHSETKCNCISCIKDSKNDVLSDSLKLHSTFHTPRKDSINDLPPALTLNFNCDSDKTVIPGVKEVLNIKSTKIGPRTKMMAFLQGMKRIRKTLSLSNSIHNEIKKRILKTPQTKITKG